MRARLLPILTLASPLLVALACGTAPAPEPTVVVAKPPPSVTSAKPSASVSAAPAPTLSGVDTAALDKSIDPCDDFYAYACGAWMKNTPIPGDRASWNRSFSEIDERNDKALDAILERDAAGKGDSSDPYYAKLGDFYAACMDETAIESAGTAPLKEAFAAIDKVKDPASLSAVVRDLYKLGFAPIFSFSSGQDFADATQVIGQLEQAGLGLPDRDYYLKTDEKNVAIRKQYEEHVGKMLSLAKAGGPADVKAVLTIETELARASMTRVDRREPLKVYHRMQLAGLKSLSPAFGWDAFFAGLEVSKNAPINVAQPDFIKGLEERLAKVKPLEWKGYLRWQVVHQAARLLPKAFVDEDFRFKSTALTGAEKLLPRWKRCVTATDDALGEALAQPFVRDTFGAEGKARASEMVAAIERTMERDLKALDWMDDATRKKAFEKLGKINNKIGFPAKWRNYDALSISRASYAKNALGAGAFELRRQLSKIGKPLDRNEWYMTPPAVNAYYDANMNEMVFPAGILQPPFFDKKSSFAMNYGAIGMVMGHELTHGFDDEGRQFDGDGNLKVWWTKDVNQKFEDKAACVIKQFNDYVVVDDVHVDGKLTLGENIADLGGLKLAYSAMKDARSGKTPEPIAGFSEEQQFFLSFAQAWCQNTRPQFARMLAAIDAHSPPRHRVNGPTSNLPEFAAAFSCKPTSKMVRKDRCEVW
jgi:putative endopeptidase